MNTSDSAARLHTVQAALLCALIAGLTLAQAAWAQPAGRINSTQRLVWQQKPDGTVNPVERGAAFEAGDTISTGRNSSAQLLFSDGGELTLRPDSQLRIEQYGYRLEAPQTDNAFFRLLKGGMRTVTGLIGKRGNQDAYRVGAVTATIGVRGTDFTARICGEDCAEESKKFPPTDRAPVPVPAARIVLAQGSVTAINAKGVARGLEEKSAVYQGDTVRTAPDGYAVLVFRDEGRMTLAADTAFTIEQFRYQQVRAEQNSVVFRLLRGGMRSITGLIAKRRPEAYRINTVIATIGVRGTGIDVRCTGACIDTKAGDSDDRKAINSKGLLAPEIGKPAGALPTVDTVDRAVVTNPGLVMQTWSGVATLTGAAGGTVNIETGQTGIVAGINELPKLVPSPPPALFDEKIPRPDKIDIDIKDMFVTVPDKYDSGLYVYVRDGKVRLSDAGKDVIIEPGEGGYADGKGGAPVKVEPPMSIKHDPWLQQISNICR
jgi:hypothetical protein